MCAKTSEPPVEGRGDLLENIHLPSKFSITRTKQRSGAECRLSAAVVTFNKDIPVSLCIAIVGRKSRDDESIWRLCVHLLLTWA